MKCLSFVLGWNGFRELAIVTFPCDDSSFATHKRNDFPSVVNLPTIGSDLSREESSENIFQRN